MVVSRLMCVAYLPPGVIMMSRPGLPPRITSEFVVLPQPRSVLIPMAHVPIRNHMDAQVLGLGHHLGPCWC